MSIVRVKIPGGVVRRALRRVLGPRRPERVPEVEPELALVVADASRRKLERVHNNVPVFVDRKKLLSPVNLFADGRALPVRRVEVVGAWGVVVSA